MSKSSRKKILLLIAELGYGGAEGSFSRLADYLNREDDVQIVLFKKNYASGNYAVNTNLPALPITVLDEGDDGRLFRWFRRWQRLRLLKLNSDVVISFLSGPNLLNSLTASHVPTVISERGSKKNDIGMSPLARWLWTRVLDPISYRRAHRIVAASEGLAGEITAANPGAASKVCAFEGTVAAKEMMLAANAPVEPEFTHFEKYKTLVSYGRMHVLKGFDVLIRHFAVVLKDCPDARLLLIGDGPKLDEYLKLARDLGLRAGTAIDPHTQDVTFAGFRADPVRYLKLGRLFAFTSRFEGLPNALIEALASGVPIISVDCPWGPRSVLAGNSDEMSLIPKTVTHAISLRHGLLLPVIDAPSSSSLWTAALSEMLRAPHHRMDRTACEFAVSRFDIEQTGPRWVAMLREVVRDVANRKGEVSEART